MGVSRAETASVAVAPPAYALPRDLQFGHLSHDQFEDLCRDLIAREYEAPDAERYGRRGQAQDGIDVVGRAGAVIAQARHVHSVSAREIHGAVRDFLSGKWSRDAEVFLYCTSASARDVKVQDAIVALKRELGDTCRRRVITFDVWDGERICRLLKQYAALVEEYWGTESAQLFCPGQRPALGALETALADALSAARPTHQLPFVVDLSDQSQSVKTALAELDSAGRPTEIRLAYELMGEPDPGEAAAALLSRPSEDLRDGSPTLWTVVVRLAERKGHWSLASTGWEQIARLRGDDADSLLSAAIAASLAQEYGRYASLFARAREHGPSLPRVVLEGLRDVDAPEARLARLRQLASEDPHVEALIAVHRALAYLQLGDVPAAANHVAAAERLNTDLVQIRMARISLEVERARQAFKTGRRVDNAALLSVEEQALALRVETLIPQSRFEESAHLIMLASDAATLRHDRRRPAEILEMVTEGELAVADNREVLGTAALRAGEWSIASRFVAAADLTTSTEVIAGIAALELGEHRGDARKRLRRVLAVASPAEGYDAGLALLLDAARTGCGWDEGAAAAVEAFDSRSVLCLRAQYLARCGRYEDAKRLLQHHADELWVTDALFRLANRAGDAERFDLAETLLLSNPNPWLRLECAVALLDNGQAVRAQSEARQVADDSALGRFERSDAYNVVLRAIEQRDDWMSAAEVLGAWIETNPSDSRLGFWQARAGNRRVRTAITS